MEMLPLDKSLLWGKTGKLTPGKGIIIIYINEKYTSHPEKKDEKEKLENS